MQLHFQRQKKNEFQGASFLEIHNNNSLKKECGQKPPNRQRNGLFFVGGILAFMGLGGWFAISVWPSLVSCGNKAKQAEGRNIAGAINRTQQGYFVEKNIFAKNLNELGAGIKDSINYHYSIRVTPKAAFNYAIAQKEASKPLKSYVGAVFVVIKQASAEAETIAILCQTNSPNTSKPAEPIYENGQPICGANTTQLSP